MMRIPGRPRLRRTFILILLTVCVLAAGAQPISPFQPENPVVMGRGGSFTATATGYNSFFVNPAGFARGGELTLASVNGWAFMDRDLVSLVQDFAGTDITLSPSIAGPARTGSTGFGSRSIDPAAFAGLEDSFADLQAWIESEDPAVVEDILQEAADNEGITFDSEDDLADLVAQAGSQDVVDFLLAVEAAAEASSADSYPDGLISSIVAELESALPGGFLRVGAQAGLGYVGNGIGLGLFANAEATVDGTNILQAFGTAYNTITFVGGLGLTFGSLHVGVAVRPTVFGYTRVNASPIISSYLAGGSVDLSTMFTSTVFYGSGLGVDVGAVWELGPLSVGLAVQDLLGTQITYRKTDFTTYYEALLTASLPAGSALTPEELAAAWTIPMKVNAGLQFHPDLGVVSFLIDPSVSVDLLDVTSAVRTWQAGNQVTADQVLEMLNFGGQVTLLRFLSLRGGYYGGYLSAGVGLDIFLIDVNAAVAGDFGRNDAGEWGFTNVGGSVEIGIRF